MNSPSDTVIVTGQAKSGKTALAIAMSAWGYEVVRASSVIRELVDASGAITRRQLLEEGLHFESPSKQKEFGDLLMFHTTSDTRVIFDGIRLPLAAERIREVRNTLFLIYVETTEKIRRERFDESTDGSISFEEMNRHPVEKSVLAMRQRADLVIDGSLNIPRNLDEIAIALA